MHRRSSWFRVVTPFAILLGLVHCSSSRPNHPNRPGPPFIQATDQKGLLPPTTDPTVVRTFNVIVDTAQLNLRTRSLSLNIFGNQRLDLAIERVEEIPKGLIAYGKVAGERNSAAIITMVQNTIAANIDTQAGKAYQIRYAGDGIYSFREIDRSKFPNEGPTLRPPARAGGGPAADTCSTDPANDIDVMVVYTAAARIGAGGQDAMEAVVYLAVAETNEAYLNSLINQRLRLVHVEEVVYTESGNFFTDLPRVATPGDGFMDNVPTLRNTYAADVVSLILETGNACGLGYFMDPVSNSFENSAYSVVARTCATGYYSFGHELGHNMSADHDLANATSTGPYPYNHGYFNTAPTSPATPWRSIMSYQTSPSSTRVRYFSNPSVSYPIGGDVMGDTTNRDNAHVLNNTAATVANFRCSSPSIGNVWMKDTWNDTGLEPDPATAVDYMWISPYIWVRNGQDTTLVHQHQHENPEFGSTNWVYVKLHNGGSTAASGNLELWYANASASLTWPGSWTMLGSIPVSGFPAHSSRVVEQAWTGLPGTGHYCMIARWNSTADPMATPEGSDINANTRGNNNIVWRNLNIVDLKPDMLGDVSLNVRSTDQSIQSITIAIQPERRPGEPQPSFFTLGRVTVDLDPVLLEAWKRGGARGGGFRETSEGLVITDNGGATLENVVLPYGEGGALRLRFQQLPSTPRGRYVIDVEQRGVQRRFTEGNFVLPPVTIGGVSYEIHANR